MGHPHNIATTNHRVKTAVEGDKLSVVDKKGRQVYLYARDYFASPYIINLINGIISGVSVVSDATLSGDGSLVSPLGVTNPFPGFTSLTADYGVTLATVATSGDYADLTNLPTIENASGNNQVQFSVTGGSFTTHDLIWEASNSSMSPLADGGASLGAAGRFFSTISGNKHTAIAGITNGFSFTGSGTSAQITTQAGAGDGLTFWANNAQRKINLAIGKGTIITDGSLGSTQEANDDVTLELVGNSVLRLAGATAAILSGITPLEGMEVRATTTDATFTSTGFWVYENGAWRKLNKDFGTTAGTVLEGDKNAAIVLNTAKITNATHAGEVTGSGVLTLDPTSISNKAAVTAASGMEILVNDAGTLKKADASDFLSTVPEEFYFQRVETIDNNSGTPLEYFTEVQGGTEITNTATFTGGTYSVDINFVCLNTSTSGSVKVDPQVDGVSVFAQPYEVEPKDNDNIYYVGIRKRITITAGVRAVDLNLTNVGSGTGRIFEANVTLTKI